MSQQSNLIGMKPILATSRDIGSSWTKWSKKQRPRFKTEAEEAKWWSDNQDLIADRFEQAKAAGKLGKGTVARIAQQKGGASPTITIRLPESDLERARNLAEKRGLRYQTYLKMLLHEALESEERRLADRRR